MGTTFKQRRGTASQWQLANPILADGEIGYAKDTGVVKFGDGVNHWNSLPAALGSTYLPVLGKAADSEKLDGHDSTDFLLTTDAVSTYLSKTEAASTYLRSDAPTSVDTANAVVKRSGTNAFAVTGITGLATPTQNDAAANKKYIDDATSQTSATRKLVTHWGSGTTFPTTGILYGDSFYHTGVGSKFAYTSVGWRQVTLSVVADAAARTAISTTYSADLHSGVRVRQTDTRATWEWDGTGWQKISTVAGRVARAQSIATDSDLVLVADAAYVAATPPGDLTLSARAGEWVRAGISYVANNAVGDVRVDVGTVVSSAIVNYLSGGTATTHGVLGMGVLGGRYESAGGSVPYQLQAGDVAAAGTVTLRPLFKAQGGGRSIFRATDSLLFWAEVIG